MDSSEDKNCSALQNVNDVFSFYSLHLASGKHALLTLKKKTDLCYFSLAYSQRELQHRRICSAGKIAQSTGAGGRSLLDTYLACTKQ